ncbi:nucleoside/nucleotide kinase family protein [Paracoccus methylarcula]|uniref:Nucleoside/nucleotide kinase family protein n=1 Tax=Paracoccus methylarcula TaxID=72022 RepID=A0A422QU54_9RHOB|nr:nucleoside/nucleotide kinase family protein [Paracoccus methylarcula]RNF33577.1 nucleoside/nucleotide kinase family protein [Paracoccus methylarcula]
MADEHRVRLAELAGILAGATGSRRLIALAGPPGSGKSHSADALCERLTRLGRSAAVLPMDGFHYDDAVLDQRSLLPRKGAPETFDTAGLRHMLGRLRRNDEPEVAVPVFDRALEISRAGARVIAAEIDLLIVEGNYLLMDRAPWSSLHEFFDVTIRLDVPEAVLRERLTKRWIKAGLAQDEIRRKVEENDLPNCRIVIEASVAADYLIEN